MKVQPLTYSSCVKDIDSPLLEALVDKLLANESPPQIIFWVHDLISPSACTPKREGRDIVVSYYTIKSEVKARLKSPVDQE